MISTVIKSDETTTCPVIRDPDQNTNDLEKALSFALKKEIQRAVVFGATGKRVDHTMKNLSVLKQFNSRFKCIFFRDRYSDIKLISSPHFTEQLSIGTVGFAISPIRNFKRHYKRGLKFPLQNDTLQNGV